MASDLWLVRHGQTEWSEAGRHTGRTDVPLTEQGRIAAAGLAPLLAGHDFALVLTSPASRARDTARIAGFPEAEIDDDLRERDYGDVEGKTTADVRARGPEWARWNVWTGSLPGGETLVAVAVRAGRVLARAAAASGDVLVFGHGHQLRILTTVALDLDPVSSMHLALDPATVSVIGFEHEIRALRAWNRRP